MQKSIVLKNVRVNNLDSIDLELPANRLIAFCGPSGSGKSSLAINTLFNEGQRKYLAAFSAGARTRLKQPSKPDAEKLENIPPAIATQRSDQILDPLMTVGSVSEISHFLQAVFASFATAHCQHCDSPIEEWTAETILADLQSLPTGTKFILAFPFSGKTSTGGIDMDVKHLLAAGFQRVIAGNAMIRLDELTKDQFDGSNEVVVDRLTTESDSARVLESIETALLFGKGQSSVYLRIDQSAEKTVSIDGSEYRVMKYSSGHLCTHCQNSFTRLSASHLSHFSPKGKCNACQGRGVVAHLDAGLLIENPDRSISDGAIPLLNRAGLKAPRKKIDQVFSDEVPEPWCSLSEAKRLEILQWLNVNLSIADNKPGSSKAHLLEKYCRSETCESCKGMRLNPDALALRFKGSSLGELYELPLNQLIRQLIDWRDDASQELKKLFASVESRVSILQRIGIDYLTLNRGINSLSSGERHRVAMSSVLGTQLVNMLLVLDEPSAGLHPTELPAMMKVIREIQKKGNMVIAIDHQWELLRETDHVVEFGPGGGTYGGKVLYEGEPARLSDSSDSITGPYLNRSAGFGTVRESKPAKRKSRSIQMRGARGNNLKNVDACFPLEQLCVVTGVSGSGKSSLVVDTLFPALAKRLGLTTSPGLPMDELTGWEQVEDVVLVDQGLVVGGSRSNPATFTKAFDLIRSLLAESPDAQALSLKPGHFSFNSADGRCDFCKGEGKIRVDMMFLPNLCVECKFCKGKRFRRQVLGVKYRDRNVFEILEMTVRQAFSFFRGQKRIQSRLKPLLDVGLDYLRMGQESHSLSSGETQRLRLAGYLTTGRKARTLFVLDEPAVGLHFVDVKKLLDCFDAILAEGNSLIVVENHPMIVRSADNLIEIGPGAADAGGRLVATGTPEDFAANANSLTWHSLNSLDPKSS